MNFHNQVQPEIKIIETLYHIADYKTYAKSGDLVNIYQKTHPTAWMGQSENGVLYPVNPVNLTSEIPEDKIPVNLPIENLRNAMIAEVKKSKPKFKALIDAIKEGLINKPMPNNITKEQWLLTAKEVLS